MDLDKYPGPYRATKLWNEAICLFRNGMPLKRHRKHIKLYENCFSGGEAVSWLHSTLQNNTNFGQDVTREKTFQLLSKFFRVGVFQSVSSGSSDCLEAFRENELYRFCCRSPLRNIQLSTLALLSRQNPPPVKGVTRSTSKCASISHKLPKRSPSFQSGYLEEIKSRAESNQLKQMEIEEVWKTVVLGRLQALLGTLSVDDLLPSNQTSGARIMKNASLANGLASYQSFNRSQLFPRWILAAMKSLIDWPHLNRGASCSIWYQGFELDVFKVIKDYFNNLESPLVTSFLYSAFINSYAYVEYVESVQEFGECASNDVEYQDISCLPSKSQENLVLNMTNASDVGDNMSHSEPLYCTLKAREIVNSFNESFSDNCGASIRGSSSRIPAVNNSSFAGYSDKNEVSQCIGESQFYSATKLLSSTLPPNACFETAFTSDSPVTRIIPRKLVENIHLTHKNRQRESVCQKSLNPVHHPHENRGSKPCDNLPDVSCNIRRNSSAPNLVDVISSSNDEISNYAAADTKKHIHDSYHTESVEYVRMQSCHPSSQILGSSIPNPTNCTAPCNQVKSKKSHVHDRLQRRSTRRKKSPSESGLNENLHHVRNKSGGYVNIALSSSVDELDQSHAFDHLLGEDLDYKKALETLHKLIKCTYRDGESESFSEVKVMSNACGNQSCSSTSSLWSYHTAASGEQSCSSTTPAATSHIVLDYNGRNPTADELMNTGVQTVQGQQLGLDILQLLLLLLPPVNRYKLHLLLYFMSNIISNGRLVLQDGICTKSLLLDTFTPCILKPEVNANGDEGLARRLVSFFVDNHQTLFQVSSGLQSEVNSHLLQLPNQVELAGSSGIPIAYCERISCQQYEGEKLTASQLALAELLDQIIVDKKMGSKEKKKRLKMFREAYPHIYHMRFPCSKKEDEKQSKSRGILGFASLSRLRNIRI